MPERRKRHTAEFKAKVALEAIKGIKTTAELVSEFQVHPTQISQWKRVAIEGLPGVFQAPSARTVPSLEAVTAPWYAHIGRLQVELDWLKKKLSGSVEAKRMAIEPQHPVLSIRRPCELTGLARSSYYWTPAPADPADLALMRRIDAQYLETPFFGSRQMAAGLSRAGEPVNRKRVQRLMRQMGRQGAVPGPHTSKPHPSHPVYPYLLGHMTIDRPNLVWSSDITYLPMARGFLYLMAIIDGYSR